ncbi:DUF1080 domain-containing protein [Telmatocola sphagniphila]|uniref:non-specific serine/threonine protein kinase n=1 Tax=Telmatocola sphagniphila TaxID=1123043 RepID=A0A8E6B6A9_9BACT|nr:family 16 glycoside hydrolase [Telmatocola sphagniphila]QVL32682.1 DUF1080 domain-containing protein [Telmatocola sphagniphila]
MKTQNTPPNHPANEELAAFALGKAIPNAETIAEHVANCARCETLIAKTPRDTFLGILNKAKPGSSLTGSQIAKSTVVPSEELPLELRQQTKYTFLKKLGGGGMGVVWLAEHNLMKRKVAVKLIPPEMIGNPTVRDRFLQEVVSAAALEHPNVVRAYAAEEFGPYMLFEMEFVDGKDLSEVVKLKGPLPVAHALKYIRQAAQALQHGMGKSLVHRDIKPGNLMLTRNGTIKVADFGLAKFSRETDKSRGRSLTGTNAIMGTPDYMAPEQARDAKTADIRADIYSLGCTFYFLLTGKPPFDGVSLADLIFKHWEDPRPDVSVLRNDVPEELARFVQKMMDKDPANRPQTPKEVIDGLNRFSADLQSAPVITNGMKSKSETLVGSDSGRNKTVVSDTLPSQPKKELEVSENRKLKTRRPTIVSAVIIFATLGLLTTAGLFWFKTGDGTISLVNFPENAEVTIDGEKINFVPKKDQPIELRVTARKQHKIEIRSGELTILSEKFAIEPGGKKLFSSRLETKSQDGFVSLFNGKDLTGWVVDSGDVNAWKVQEGTLTVHGLASESGWYALQDQSYLLSDRDYKDFILRCQFQQLSKEILSGIAFRAVPGERASNTDPSRITGNNQPLHLTAFLENSTTTNFPTGSLWWSVAYMGSSPILLPDNRCNLKNLGEWNELEIELKGQSFRMSVNGQELQNVMLNKIAQPSLLNPGLRRYSGRIGLLKRTGDIRYRNIEIKELPQDLQFNLPEKNEPRVPSVDPKLRQSFKNAPGDWTIVNGELLQQSPDFGDSTLIFGDKNWKNYDFSCEVMKISGRGEAGLVYRANNDGRSEFILGRYIGLVESAVSLVGSDRKRMRERRTNPMADNQWYKLEIRVRGNRFQGFIDNEAAFDFQTDRNPEGGIGVRTWRTAAKFRNFRVTTPEGKLLFDGLPELPATPVDWILDS